VDVTNFSVDVISIPNLPDQRATNNTGLFITQPATKWSDVACISNRKRSWCASKPLVRTIREKVLGTHGFYARVAFLIVFSFVAIPFTTVSGQNSSVRVQAIANALRIQDYETALNLTRVLVQTQPNDPRNWTLEGIVFLDMKRTQEGLRAFQSALRLQPDYIPALEGAAQVQYNSQYPASARPLLERLIELRPQDQMVHAMLGALAYQDKRCSSAVTHFRKGGTVIQNNLTALSELGGCLLRLHRAAEAVAVFARITTLQTEDWHSRYNLAVAEFEANEYAEAVQSLQPLLEKPHGNAAMLNLAASCYEAQDKIPQAVATLRRAMLLAPYDVQNYLDLAAISLDHGSFRAGIDVLDVGLGRLPHSWKLHAARGVLYVQLGNFKEANADFELASRLQPSQQTANIAMGIALVQEHHLNKSLNFVRSRLRKSPNDAALDYLLAEILIRKGVTPGSPEFEEAIQAATRAKKLNPDFVLARDDLAQLQLVAGHLHAAIRESQRALAVDPSDRTAVYHLIVAYRRTHQTAAVAALTKRLAVLSNAALKRDEQRNRVRLVVNDLPADGLHPSKTTK
jgi:tetratricopeptide (TPR) repeat protein